MAHLSAPTTLVYLANPDAPRIAAVQIEPRDDPHYEVRARRPGPPGRSWLVRVQVCRLQPGWGHLGTPVGVDRASLNLDRRTVLAWWVVERGWAFPGVPALVNEPGWSGLTDDHGRVRWTGARAYQDERVARMAYDTGRLQVLGLVRRLRTDVVWRGVPDDDLGDALLSATGSGWHNENGRVWSAPTLPGAWTP